MDNIKNLILESLVTEDEDDIFRDRTRSDNEAFQSGLERGTDPEDFETEGSGIDVDGRRADQFVDAYAKVENLDRTIDDLISPDDGRGSLLKLLSDLDTNDSIAKGVADRVRKDAKKASDSLASIVNELNVIASMESTLRRKIESLRSK